MLRYLSHADGLVFGSMITKQLSPDPFARPGAQKGRLPQTIGKLLKITSSVSFDMDFIIYSSQTH